MKKLLRKLFSPLLTIFESGDEAYVYKSMNRKILLIVGFLFCSLASFVTYAYHDSGDLGFLIPTCVFGGIGFVCLVVGALGNERAVSKIWGHK